MRHCKLCTKHRAWQMANAQAVTMDRIRAFSSKWQDRGSNLCDPESVPSLALCFLIPNGWGWQNVWLGHVNHPATGGRSPWLSWRPQVSHLAPSEMGHPAPHCSSKEGGRKEVGETWIQILSPLVKIVKPLARWPVAALL